MHCEPIHRLVMHSVALSGFTLLLVTRAALSQQLPRTFPVVHDDIARVVSAPVQVPAEPGIHSPLLAAAGLGALGWGAGALAGHFAQGDCYEDFCELEGIFYGGAAGGGLGLALGAHLGNRRRGNFLLDVAASGAIWGAGYGLIRSFASRDDGVGVALTAILLPPTQLLTTVLVERASGRARAGRSP